MAKRVEVKTVITQIIKDGSYSPESPLFAFVNDGNFDLHIDNLRIRPGETFSINADPLVANFIDKNIPVINKSQYQLNFEILPGGGRVSAQLIETFVKLI